MEYLLKECTLSNFKELFVADREIFPDFWTEEMWKGELTRSDFLGFAAYFQGELAGYICGTALFEEGEIPKVAVREKYRKTGLGMKLVAAMVACMRKKGVEKIFLEVRISNAAALGLYIKNGFEKTRIRNRYYPDGEDAVEMLKVLE